MRILILLLIFITHSLSDTITLTRALDMLKKQNLSLKIAQFDVDAASFSQDEANAQHYGELNFIQNIFRSNDAGNVFGYALTSREATFGNFGFADFDSSNPNILNVAPNDLNHPDDRNLFQSKLVYELPLYTGSKISSYEEIAKEMKQISILDKQSQLQEKIYETRKSFFNMALLDNSLKNLELILNNIQILEDTTQNMIDEGYAKKVDILEVRSKKANVTRLISQLQANKDLLYHYISFLLNQDVKDIDAPSYDISTPSIDVDEILSRNIDIKKAQTALVIQKSMLDIEESNYLPTIGAMAEIQTSDDTFLGDASDHKSYTVGVQLKWNIFAGGADSASIQKARVNQLKSQAQVELAKEGITLKIKEIQTGIKRESSEIKNLETELALAQEIYKNYEGRYKEQLVSMNDVIIKQSVWLERILQLLQAKNSRNQQIFALERLAQLGETE